MRPVNANKLNKISINSLICLSFIAFGFAIGKFVNIIKYFKVDTEINLVEFSSLFATIALGLYISTVLDKNKQDTRIEKDILIKRVEEISKALEDTVQKTLLGQTTVQEAASQIKTTNTSIDAIYKLINVQDASTSADLKTDLKSNIKRIRVLLTSTPVTLKDQVQKSNMPIEVKDNIILLALERRVEIQSATEGFKQNMIRLQFFINRT